MDFNQYDIISLPVYDCYEEVCAVRESQIMSEVFNFDGEDYVVLDTLELWPISELQEEVDVALEYE